MKVTYIGPCDSVDVPVPEGAPDLPAGGVVTVERDKALDTTKDHAEALAAQTVWESATAKKPRRGDNDGEAAS